MLRPKNKKYKIILNCPTNNCEQVPYPLSMVDICLVAFDIVFTKTIPQEERESASVQCITKYILLKGSTCQIESDYKT